MGARFRGHVYPQPRGLLPKAERNWADIAGVGDVLLSGDLNGEALIGPQFRYWTCPTLFPESANVLHHVAVPVCLVSNIDDADLYSALEHLGLSFDRIVTSEGCQAYKPRAEMFRRALNLLRLPKEDVLHIGDSLSSNVQGAAGVGIRALWVNRKQRRIPTGGPRPDHISSDLTGILDVLD